MKVHSFVHALCHILGCFVTETVNLLQYPRCLHNNDVSTKENIAGLVEAALRAPFVKSYDGLLYKFETGAVIIPPNATQCHAYKSMHHCRVAIESIIVTCTISSLGIEISELSTAIAREKYRFSNLEVNITASYEIAPPNYVLAIQPSPDATGNAVDFNFERMRACLHSTNTTEHKECANALLGLFVERRATSSCRITSIDADYYI